MSDVVIVNLVWLNHDARHVSTKWISVIFSDLIHALSADHWESCFNLGLVALLQVLLRKNYGLICDCLDLSGELLDARLRFLQCFVQLLVDEDVVLIRHLQASVLFLQYLVVVP